MATGNEFPKPPPEELTDKPAPVRRKVARTAAFKAARAAAAPRKSVLIINDNDSAYSDESQSVAIFMSAFKALGYDVNLEKSEDTSYTTWKNYDIVVWSCSDDYSAVSEDKYKQMLIKYVVSGGHLILESGNVAGWNKEEGVTTLDRRFREQVLYATDDWVYHDVGDLKLKTNHPIATTPNILPKTISFTPTDPADESGDANAVRILPGAIGIFNWSYVAYDGNHVNDDIENNSYGLIACNVSAENGGRIVYFAFDIDDIADPDIQQKLIQNSENWLSQKPSIPPRDDPFGRHEELKLDRIKGSEGQKLAILRLTALEHARKMPKAEVEARIETMEPTPGISNWVQMGPATIAKGQTYGGARVLVTGRVTAIVVDPTDSDIIYVGAAQGGIWKTTDGGKNWIPTSDNEDTLSIGALAMDPTNHLVLYGGTGEENFSEDSFEGYGVLKTTDGGKTWTLQGKDNFASARFGRIAVDPTTPSTLFAATTYGVYRSTDGGKSWTLMTEGLPPVTNDHKPIATDIVIDPTAPSTLYAAFLGYGIYKATDADADTPTWERLTGGLPPSGNFTRIALGISPSSPQTLYALMADNDGNLIDKFYLTNNSGAAWSSIPLPDGDIGITESGERVGQGAYNLNVAVDPTTPDIVYLSGISVWKAVRNPATDVWTITEIGSNIHADNHAFAFDHTNHLAIYAGNDGGIFKSTDGGNTWIDTINKGLCITQFEFIDQNPNFNAVVCGGTQDNGTEQFRNSPVFYHSKEGDGGFVAIDQNDPKNMLSTYTRLTPQYSNQGGQFESWNDVSDGLSGESLFYPPMTLDQSNPNNAAIGGSKLFLDDKQGNGGWQTSVTLPGMKGMVSAINYVNSNLIYVGTTNGEVYCLMKSGDIWTRTAIHDSSLPQGWIWDVGIRPNDPNTIIVVMAEDPWAEHGSPQLHHVWRGEVSANISATWTDISANLPDTPVYSLVIDPEASDTMYIGTEVGVFRTTNGGTSWIFFSEGLPTVAVYDMRLHSPTRLLRAVTHGRGMWERKLDATSMPDVNIYMRSNLMDTRRVIPTPSNIIAAFDDPLQHVAFGDQLSWDQCADIKIDAQGGSTSDYQMNVADVDYVAFESVLEHRNPQHQAVNRIYVQVHNRGIKPATNVTVKILYADASRGCPDLPSDFWTAFPGDPADTSQWEPIGSTKVIQSLLPTQPAVLEWDWNTPTTASDHSCLLVVTDCPDDSIPAANKVLNIAALIPNEKHVGLRKLDVV